jgi:hypothetical protein
MSYRGQFNPARPGADDPRAALAAEMAAERAAERRGMLVPSRPPPAGSANERFDIRELLRREADVVRPPPDQRGVSDQYIVLDSFAKDAARSNPGAGTFAWNFAVQGSTGNGAVGVRDRVDHVTEVQISPFALPPPPQIPYPVPTIRVQIPPLTPDTNPPLNTTPAGAIVPGAAALPLRATNSATLAAPTSAPYFSQIACGGRFTIQLVEAGLQSFSSLAGTRYHFDMVARDHAPVGAAGDVNAGAGDIGVPGFPFAMPLAVSPLTNWDTYLFTDPLMDVHGLTLMFRNPDVPIQFQPDVLYQTTVTVVSPAYLTTDATHFPYGPPTITNPVPPIPAPALPGGATWNSNIAGSFYLSFGYVAHGLLSGDQVVIGGFNSGNATLDAYVNRPQGHLVGTPLVQTPAVQPAPVAQGVALPTPDSFALDPMPDVTNLLFQYFVPATRQAYDATGAVLSGQFVPVIDNSGQLVTVGIPSYWMPPQAVNVYVLKRRIRIPIRFRRSIDRPTNDIISVN